MECPRHAGDPLHPAHPELLRFVLKPRKGSHQNVPFCLGRIQGAIYQGADTVPLEYDILIAGALLHDVGKLVEYSKGKDGKYVKSALGRDLRHPFSGTVIAMRNGISSKIAHTIATHASEGEGTLRTPEAVIINKIDMMNFEVLKSHRGLI